MNQQTKISGRDHYAAIYASELDAQAKWLAFGAVEKANSIEILLRRVCFQPRTVLELGAGTGAIISELKRRNFAERYIAVDYSLEACDYMRQNLPDVEIICADVTTQLIDHDVDVVVVSHVVEHLEEPGRLLDAIARNIRCQWIVIECPLEDLVASRLKNLLRDRMKNLAGHVQFYTAASLRKLISDHFHIADRRYYVTGMPKSVIDFLAEKNDMSTTKRFIKYLTLGILPRLTAPIWKRVWLGNYATLCRPKR